MPGDSQIREQRFARAEQVLGEWLLHRQELPAVALPDLIGTHPDLAAELLALARDLQLVDGILAAEQHRSAADADAVAAMVAGLRRQEGFAARFEIKRQIGQGGMGRVFEVFDRQLQRTVAMKVLLAQVVDPTRSVGSGQLGRFISEARITSQLQHPAIVPVHDVGIDPDGRVWFTMKLVGGQTLGAILERQAAGDAEWPRERILSVMQRACEALAYAHAQGVVHRDLKPANIMVGDFGEVCVMDWGLARRTGDPADDGALPDTDSLATSAKTRYGSVLGTPAYMPPEQAGGRLQEIGPHSDVYALGAMLWHLIAGHAPYDDASQSQSASELVQRIAAGPPPPLPADRAPGELLAICERATAHDWRLRYPTVQDLAADLRAFLEGRSVSAYASGPWVEARMWIRRNRGLAASILFAGVALLAGTIGTTTQYLAAASREADIVRLADQHAQQLREFDLLALKQEHQSLMRAEANFYPAVPEHADAMRAWLDGPCRRLESARADIERAIAGIDHRAPEAAGPEQRRDQVLRQALHELLTDLATLPAVRDRVQRRLLWAEQVDRLTTAHPGSGVSWEAAAAAIAAADDVVASSLYAAATSDKHPIHLAPQRGLVPIGMNPITKLWEFYDLYSAWDGSSDPAAIAIPRHDGEGKVAMTEQTGIVFVLVPGGTFTQGAQNRYRTDPNWDEDACADESPDEDLRLAPFLIARHELTQAQWARLWTWDEHYRVPSNHRSDQIVGPRRITGVHPVESVSHDMATQLLERSGMTLPTEAQWEYACRATTTSPWWCGPAATDLKGCANLLDLSATDATKDCGEPVPWRDQYAVHAPVGSFRPNRFGLFDTCGNVAEWCADAYRHSYYAQKRRTGDGLREHPNPREDRVTRGGSFVSNPVVARSATRLPNVRRFCDAIVGLRAARPLSPP